MNQSCCFRRGCIFLVILALSSFALIQSQPLLSYQPVTISALNQPVDLVNAGDGTNRVFIVERLGVIKVFDQNFNLLDTFLTVTGLSTTGGEQGLLSLAFHPQYATNGYFFVYYTNSAGNVEISRYKVSDTDDNVADPTTRDILLTAVKNISERNHNGGDLNFGPDGNLYVGIGDAGGGGDPENNAQDPAILYGKMIRINVNDFSSDTYSIPADNPYANSNDTLPEIWAFGLRNPWRWSFDRQTGDMWIADVGQSQWEEVNFIPAGSNSRRNFGWKCFEGDFDYGAGCEIQGDHTPPIFYYPHNNQVGGISVTGGFVYRGTQFPLLLGQYIMADYISGNSWLIAPDGAGGWDTSRQAGAPTQIVSFGEREDGELYMLTLSGNLYQVTSSTVFPVTITQFTATVKGNTVELVWDTEMEHNLSHYNIEYSTDNRTFRAAGKINASGGSRYKYTHTPPTDAEIIYYRLKSVDLDASYKYSKIISARLPSLKGAAVVNTLIQNNSVQLLLDKQFDEVQLVDLNGRLIWRQSLVGRTGRVSLTTPSLQKGTYLVRIVGIGGSIVERVFVR